VEEGANGSRTLLPHERLNADRTRCGVLFDDVDTDPEQLSNRAV
jgi:hypothetical protein